MKVLLKRKRELIIVALLSLIYVSCFFLLEKIEFNHYIYTELWIDNYIPFIDVFVIPYILWFAYIVLGFVFFILKDLKGYYRTLFYLFAGMYICLIIYTIFPNAQGLRVEGIGDTFFEQLVLQFYNNDTCTNVCPSIHVYNSIMMHVSLVKNKSFKDHKFINYASLILCISICLSTVFIKQHAAIDGVFSIGLCLIIYKAEQWFKKFYPKDI